MVNIGVLPAVGTGGLRQYLGYRFAIESSVEPANGYVLTAQPQDEWDGFPLQ